MREFCNSERCNLGPKANYLVFWKEKPKKRKSPQKRRQADVILINFLSAGDEGQPTSGLRPDHWFQIIRQQCAPAKITNMCLKNICVDIASFDSFSHLFKRNKSLPNFEALIALVGVWRENQRRFSTKLVPELHGKFQGLAGVWGDC